MDEADLLRKVGALLAKAENTEFEHEANAFFAKAHELMIEHSVDEARVRAAHKASGDAKIEKPVVEDFMFATYDHHAKSKVELLEQVARSHHVKIWIYNNKRGDNVHRPGNQGLFSQWCKLAGYKADIEAVKLLYLNLLIQSLRFANEDYRKSGRNEGKFGYITGHMFGFAERIGRRFAEIDKQLAEATPDTRALMRNIDEEVEYWYNTEILGYKVYCNQDSPDGNAYCRLEKYHEGPHAFTNFYKCYEYASSAQLKAAKLPSKGRNGAYCAKNRGHYPGTMHEYTMPAGSSSGYVRTGRERQVDAAGRTAGREAAERADIGLAKVATGGRRLGGG